MAVYQSLKELSRDQFLNPTECARLCSCPNKKTLLGTRDYAILKVFLNCGLRKQELINLDVKDFCNEDNNYWLIVHGKGNTVDEQDLMNMHVIEAIKKYLAKAGHGDDPNAPLFQPLKGKNKLSTLRLNRRSVDFLIKKYSKQAQLTKSVHAHTLRHTFGTQLQSITKDVIIVQRAMRHRSLSSTMIYLHTARDTVKNSLAELSL